MASTGTKLAEQKSVSAAVLPATERRPLHAPEFNAGPEKKTIGYGLPCSHCHAYYPADMPACPICKCPDRVSPTEPVVHSMGPVAEQPAASSSIDDERERLLKELKSQAFASHTQINPTTTFRCVLTHQHTGAAEPAAVCHTCYSDARQQADRAEAALHMETKEAAKIVYDAVWANTSDPNASYSNAARALLTELRKRAGIGTVLGPNQPLAH
jgi:hypothetical protein